jgi:hypothetical protein
MQFHSAAFPKCSSIQQLSLNAVLAYSAIRRALKKERINTGAYMRRQEYLRQHDHKNEHSVEI